MDVQVWIVASDMLFHGLKVFGNVKLVIVDEAIWRKGVRGIIEDAEETEKEKKRDELSISNLLKPGPFDQSITGLRDHYRNVLGRMLQTNGVGSLGRDHIAFTLKDCRHAIGIERRLMPKLKELQPGLPASAIKGVMARNKKLIGEIRKTHVIIKILEEVRRLQWRVDIEVSGRVLSDGHHVTWRGIAEIAEKFDVPTLLLDATLPELPILKVYHPRAEVVARIKVAMPAHVHIRQVLHAPTSSSKLNDTTHIKEVQLYIWRRWFETDRGETLVIAQKKVDVYLTEHLQLPHNVTVTHYKDISGLDAFRNVRLLIMVGRTAAGPDKMEALALSRKRFRTMAVALSGIHRASGSSV
jgi:hypothetical protein